MKGLWGLWGECVCVCVFVQRNVVKGECVCVCATPVTKEVSRILKARFEAGGQRSPWGSLANEDAPREGCKRTCRLVCE